MCRDRIVAQAYLHDGRVDLDVHIVPNLIGAEVGAERDVTLSPESSGELVPGPGP